MKTETDFDIREAKRTDVPSFVATIARAKTIGNVTPKAYLNWIVRDGIALVAEHNDKNIGFLLAEKNSNAAAHVNYLYVHPRHRGKGLGSILVRHFLGTCRKKGIKYVDLNAKKNTVGFYRNFGFKSEGKYAVLYRRLRPN